MYIYCKSQWFFTLKSKFKFCRFVNDVLQKRLKEFTEIDKRVDVVNGSFPIKRTHREFIVVTVMHL